jgi:hypothetical protein
MGFIPLEGLLALTSICKERLFNPSTKPQPKGKIVLMSPLCRVLEALLKPEPDAVALFHADAQEYSYHWTQECWDIT